MGHAAASTHGVVWIVAASGNALDPRSWDAVVYFGLIVGLLLLRFIVPWPKSGPIHFVEELCLIVPAGLFYFFVRGLVAADSAIAVAHALRIVRLERELGIFVEPRLQQAMLDHHWLVDVTSWLYIWAHWPVIFVWIAWMWTRHRSAYSVYRNAFLLSGIAGMAISAVYPAAPPRLLPDLGFVDTVALHSPAYRILQPPALTNPFAAMPSLHFGWDLLVGIAIVQNARTLAGRLFGALLPLVMFAAIVGTANHFVLDAVAGIALALVGLALSIALTRRGARVPAGVGHKRRGAVDRGTLGGRKEADERATGALQPLRGRSLGDRGRRPAPLTASGADVACSGGRNLAARYHDAQLDGAGVDGDRVAAAPQVFDADVQDGLAAPRGVGLAQQEDRVRVERLARAEVDQRHLIGAPALEEERHRRAIVLRRQDGEPADTGALPLAQCDAESLVASRGRRGLLRAVLGFRCFLGAFRGRGRIVGGALRRR